MSPRLPAWVGTAAKLVLTAALIALIASKVDLDAAWMRAQQLPLWAGISALCLALAQAVMNALRWRVVAAAEGAELSPGLAMRSVFQGLFFNQALPSVVGGDALRVVYATQAGLDAGRAVRSVVLDRIAGMAALVLLAAASQPMFIDRVDNVAAQGASLAIVALGLGGVVGILALASLPMGWRRFRPIAATVSLSRCARHICSRPALFLPIFGFSLAGHALFLAGVICLARGLGLEVGIADCLAVVPVALLLSMAPISIAGWGVREGVMVAGLGLLGVDADGALALSVLMGLVVLGSSLPGGVGWLADTVRRKAGTMPDPAGAGQTRG